MIYVMSDIHGRIDLFNQMLDKINLQKGDKLYILGDCIDRGGGLEVLLKIMELHKNGLCDFLWGNHEYMFCTNYAYHLDNNTIADYERSVLKLSIFDESKKITRNPENSFELLYNLFHATKKLFKTIENNSIIKELQSKINNSICITRFCSNAEEWETFKDINDLSSEEKSEVFDFLMNHAIPDEKYIEVGEKSYLLLHGGLCDDLKNGEIPIEQLYVRDEFYRNPVNKEILKKRGYKEDTVVVFGHTTTRDINICMNGTYVAPSKIWYDLEHKDKIGIDCGASFPNGQLACLRLDDMQEFYEKNEQNSIVSIEKIGNILREFKELENYYVMEE